jgi:uncharacterized metal-binding protein (TIGR02443 family)
LIACPKCSSKAVVIPLGEDKVRASCVECGYTMDKSSKNRIALFKAIDELKAKA